MNKIFTIILGIIIGAVLLRLILRLAGMLLKVALIVVIIGVLIFAAYKLGLIDYFRQLIYHPTSKSETMPDLSNKKVALIIAFKDFKDQEYFPTKQELENAGVEVTTVSDQAGTAAGSSGGEVKVDQTLAELQVQDFDGIAFIGGPGAVDHLDNQQSYTIARKAKQQGKILGAICISPTILAKAGVLEGKKATVWHSPMNKDPVKILEDQGAVFEDRKVVTDGRIITGSGPAAAREFGQELVRALQ